MTNPTINPLPDGPYLTLSQAARKFPGHRGADRLHPATLTRWILSGVSAPGGRRVKLEAVRVGHRWLTTAAALARFAAALTPPPDDATATAAVPSPHCRRLASDRAAAALIKAGA